MELMHAAHVPAGSGPFPTLLALHGFGASAHDLLGIAPVANHAISVTMAIAIATGTKTRATRSASRCTSARLPWARSTSSITAIGTDGLCSEIDMDGVMSWTNSAGGSWFVASNWSGGSVPNDHDCVLIDAPGTYTVTIPSGTATTVKG